MKEPDLEIQTLPGKLIDAAVCTGQISTESGTFHLLIAALTGKPVSQALEEAGRIDAARTDVLPAVDSQSSNA